MTPYHQQDGITIFCAKWEEVLPQLLEQSVDMVLCDLPYGVTEIDWDKVELDLEQLWIGYERVVKRRSAIVLFGRQPFTSKLVLSKPGWFRDEIIWEKDRAVGHLDAEKRPMRAHENIVVFGADRPNFFPQKTQGHRPAPNPGVPITGHMSEMLRPGLKQSYARVGRTDRYPRSVQKFNMPNGNSRGFHPTQKPVELCAWLIRSYSNEGDLVLDNCCGSGTTLVAAKMSQRRVIGIEQMEKYCEIAVKRLAQMELFHDRP